VMTLSIVLLPQPDGPMIAPKWPFGKETEISARSGRTSSPLPINNVTSLSSSTKRYTAGFRHGLTTQKHRTFLPTEGLCRGGCADDFLLCAHGDDALREFQGAQHLRDGTEISLPLTSRCLLRTCRLPWGNFAPRADLRQRFVAKDGKQTLFKMEGKG